MSNPLLPSSDPAMTAMIDQIAAELREPYDRTLAELQGQIRKGWAMNDLLSFAVGHLIAVEKFGMSDALPLLAYALVQTAITKEEQA